MTGKSFWVIYGLAFEGPYDIHIFSNLGDALRYARKHHVYGFPDYLEEVLDGGHLTGDGNELAV